MRRITALLTGAVAAFLALAVPLPVFAITGGSLDGNAHPAVGIIIGTDSDPDNCSGNHQFIASCSVTLIAPDVVLTSRNCTLTWQSGLDQGVVDEVWVIFGEDPHAPGQTAFDCTRFVDVLESGIHSNAQSGPNLGVIELASPVSGIAPAVLPEENALRTVPRGQDNLTFVSMSITPGTTVNTLRRRSAVGRTDPPLLDESHRVVITSPAGACFGGFVDGGATFLGATNEIVSLTLGFVECPATTLLPRLDSPAARAFLGGFVTLP